MKPNRKNHEQSSHIDKEDSKLKRATCLVLGIAFAVCAIMSVITGSLGALILAGFFSALFIIMASRLRCLKLKVGSLEIEAHFK